MSVKKYISVLVLVALVSSLSAQRWKRYRQEVTFGAGTTWFLSDVGGFNDEPSNSITDINFKGTSWGIHAGYNYYLTKNISVVGQFTYGWLTAKDAHSGNEARKYRNMDIRTHLYELAVLGRYYFIREKFGHAFRLRGSQSSFLYNLSAYATLGIAGVYFNPTGRSPYDSKYYKLHELGTEGQTVEGSGVEQYKRLTLAIPVGLGVKYTLGARWSVGGEVLFRKSFSDYMDDTGGVYYDNDAIVAANGGDKNAGYLADPSVSRETGSTKTDPGQIRGGDTYKDFYAGFMISASYKLFKGRAFRPRF